MLTCSLSVCRVGSGFGIPSCAEIQPLSTAQMLVEEVPGCWWRKSWYVGWAAFWWYFRKKIFVLKATRLSVSMAANVSLDVQGGSVRPPDWRLCLNLEVHRGVGPAGLVSLQAPRLREPCHRLEWLLTSSTHWRCWNSGTWAPAQCVCVVRGAFRGMLWEVVSLGNLRPPHRAAVPGEGDLLPLRGISAMNISAYKNLWPKSRNSHSDS